MPDNGGLPEPCQCQSRRPEPIPERPTDSPPPTAEDLKHQIAAAAESKTFDSAPHSELGQRLTRYKEARAQLVNYPGARKLPGGPDDEILGRCLNLAGNDTDVLFQALRRMAIARKEPSSSWAWFPTVLRQYLGGAH